MEGKAKQLEKANSLKELGIDFYCSEQFQDATKCYHQILELLNDERTQTEAEKEQRDNLVILTHLNLAACEQKLGENVKVIEHCNLALQMDGENVIALSRRCQAYQNLALMDYADTKTMEPSNEDVVKLSEEMQKEKEKFQEFLEDREILKCPRVTDSEQTQPAGASNPRLWPLDTAVVSKIIHIVKGFLMPMTVLTVFQKYSPNIFTTSDKEKIEQDTQNHGNMAGATTLLTRLQYYEDWFCTLLSVLRDPDVKLPHVAEEIEYVAGIDATEQVEEGPENSQTSSHLFSTILVSILHPQFTLTKAVRLYEEKLYLNEQITSLEKDLEAKDSKMKEQNEQYKKELEDMKKIQEAEQRLAEKESNRLKEQNEQHKKELEDMKKIREAEQRLAEKESNRLKEQNEQHKKELEDMKKIREAEQRLPEKESNRLKEQNEQHKKELEDMKKIREAEQRLAEKESNRLKEQNKQHKKELEDMKKIQEAEQRLAEKESNRLKEQNEQHKKQLEEMEKIQEAEQRQTEKGPKRLKDQTEQHKKQPEDMKKIREAEQRQAEKESNKVKEEIREKDEGISKLQSEDVYQGLSLLAGAAVGGDRQQTGFEARLPVGQRVEILQGQTITCMTEVTFDPGHHFDPKTGIYTVPVRGRYRVRLTHRQERTEGGGDIELFVRHEGGDPGREHGRVRDVFVTQTWGKGCLGGGDSQVQDSSEDVIEMGVGDRVWVWVWDVESGERLVSPSIVSCVLKEEL